METRATRLLLLSITLGRQRFECESQQFAHARVLLAREALQSGALIRGDADGDLPVRIARRFATIEIEPGDCSANDLACGSEAMAFSAGFDSRDERFGKIKREGSRRLARCFCHTTSGLKACDGTSRHSQRLGGNEKFQLYADRIREVRLNTAEYEGESLFRRSHDPPGFRRNVNLHVSIMTY
jgi:hypothetical protein